MSFSTPLSHGTGCRLPSTRPFAKFKGGALGNPSLGGEISLLPSIARVLFRRECFVGYLFETLTTSLFFEQPYFTQYGGLRNLEKLPADSRCAPSRSYCSLTSDKYLIHFSQA